SCLEFFRVALLFVCQGTMSPVFVGAVGHPWPQLNQYITGISFCQQTFLFFSSLLQKAFPLLTVELYSISTFFICQYFIACFL
ncbi:MAG: hypothetical protein NC123_08140, partial [Butyrivibrio sp.]|nr:hypothetical protein [Butyrivibrio sp.]